jgi:hypothetical protein
MHSSFDLPPRRGPRPETTHPSREQPGPHKQISQNAPPEWQEALFERVQALPGVVIRNSCISVPGARAFHLDEVMARGPKEAFQCQREFAHLHPAHDGSLHAALPPEVYQAVQARGWGEPHPVSGTMMVFGPRDEAELETVLRIVSASYSYATGAWGEVATSRRDGGWESRRA